MALLFIIAQELASPSGSSIQKRLQDQRLKRLSTVVEGPYSFGQPHQRHPGFKTWMTPEITRRSSTR